MYLDAKNYEVTPEYLVKYDEDGFLIDTESWNEKLAFQIAVEEEILPLTDCHWKVIHHIRERYFAVGALPPLRLMCKATQLTREDIQLMFGNYRTIWRVAGLPNPGEEVMAYF